MPHKKGIHKHRQKKHPSLREKLLCSKAFSNSRKKKSKPVNSSIGISVLFLLGQLNVHRIMQNTFPATCNICVIDIRTTVLLLG